MSTIYTPSRTAATSVLSAICKATGGTLHTNDENEDFMLLNTEQYKAIINVDRQYYRPTESHYVISFRIINGNRVNGVKYPAYGKAIYGDGRTRKANLIRVSRTKSPERVAEEVVKRLLPVVAEHTAEAVAKFDTNKRWADTISNNKAAIERATGDKFNNDMTTLTTSINGVYAHINAGNSKVRISIDVDIEKAIEIIALLKKA